MTLVESYSFYKIIWIFYLAALLGDIVETIFCYYKTGKWMSRSSIVWGPFSIVWGGAIVLATISLFHYKDSPHVFLFFIGAFLGGIFEYFCSVFTEKIFGKVFWDYEKVPYNLNGRINLLYCFYLGIAAVVWLKYIYPPVSNGIEMILTYDKSVDVTWFMFVFMMRDMFISCIALIRSGQRA